MSRNYSAVIAASLAASLPGMVVAQINVGGGQQVSLPVAAAAADSAKNAIRDRAVGTGYTIDSVNQGILNQNRAFGASTGFFAVPTSNSSLLAGSPGMGSSALSGGKPFAGLQQSSTVSPYLNLFNQGPTGRSQTLDNYNLLVRPMLDQQNMNSAVRRQQQQMNMQVQAIAAKPDFEFSGSERIIPTGHQTGFGYYSHFYPGKNINRRQK